MIESITSSNSFSAQQAGRPQGPPPPPPPSQTGDSSESTSIFDAMQSAATELAEAVGMSDEELSSLKLSIQEALDELGQDASPREIGDKVSEIVQEYGIDPEDFHEALGPPPNAQRSASSSSSGYGSYDTQSQLGQSIGYDIFSSLYSLDLQA